MAMSGGIYRRALWLSCLFCALFVVATADAATRKFVKLPSKSSVAQNPSLPPSRSGDSIQVTGQALEGEFLPGESGTKGVPIKVLPRLDGSISRMFEHAKTGMKGGALGVAGSIGLGLMLDQIDGIIEDNIIKVPAYSPLEPSSDWRVYGGPSSLGNGRHPSASAACEYARFYHSNGGPGGYLYVSSIIEFLRLNSGYSTPTYSCVLKRLDTGATLGVTHVSKLTPCPADSVLDKDGACSVADGYTPATDADFDLMFDYAAQQDAGWLAGLINDVCRGSLAPERCFSDMWDQKPMHGPSTVQGPSTTKTTTTTGPDGVTSQTVTTTNTKYDITYGDNYYDYRKTETTKVEKDGVTESETTETEPEEVEQEDKSEEEKEEEKEEEEPSPCEGTNCDGPAYEDQYEPTTETKQDFIDDYMDRVQQIPILTAIGGMFDISVSGACPIWELHHAMPLMGTVFNIDLVFDFLCLSWFVAYGPWIRAVIYAVAAFAAVRVALL